VNAPVRALFGGQALADWIREGGRPQRRIIAYSAQLWWHAYWFEHNWRTQAPRLAPLALPIDPVFVVGLWRSGTTVFHELLAAATGWRTPKTWQCFNPSTYLLTDAPPQVSIAARPMDEGRIVTHGPQEDEFALLLLGESSVYRGFIDPRRLRECGTHLWSCSEGTLARWQDFVRGIAATASPRRLLLKSPSHSFRLPLLCALFPRSKFIWIGRPVDEVLASNVKMWRAMMDHYSLWTCPRDTLVGFLQDMQRACVSVLTRCLDEMPRDRMLWVDFDELRADPRRTLENALRFVGHDPGRDDSSRSRCVEEALAQVPIYAGSRTAVSMDQDAQGLQQLMSAARQHFA
jgi:hypothetical protein